MGGGKLVPSRTSGGHRRYSLGQFDGFIRDNRSDRFDYGELYQHLCSAQYIADGLRDVHAGDIMRIRQEVGDVLLDILMRGDRLGSVVC